MSAVAQRYAAALMGASRDATALDAVRADAKALADLAESSEAFAVFLDHPRIPVDKRDELLNLLFADKLQSVTLDFLRLLSHKQRLGILVEILRVFQEALDAEKGIVTVWVRSAEKLIQRQEAEISAKLAKRLGKTIRLETEVDPGLIGGFLVKVGDTIEDYSLATKLETFKRNVINA